MMYLLQCSLCLGVFYTFYWLVLRHEKGFRANRFYLLLTLLGSFVIPLVNIPVEVIIEVTESTNVNPVQNDIALDENPVVPETTTFYEQFLVQLPNVLLGVFLLGMAIRLFVLIRHCWILYRLISSGDCIKKGGVLHVYNADVDTIFSFGNTIFWGGQVPHSSDKERILQHEMAHIEQYHTLDILFCELLKIPFWFNPFIYWYKNSLQQVHEYLADEAVVKKEGRVVEYANLLVQQAKKYTRVYSISNLLFQKPIKNRLMMLKRPKQVLRHSMKMMSMAPIVLGLCYSLCVEYQYVDKAKTIGEPELNTAVMVDSIVQPSKPPLERKKGHCYAKCMLSPQIVTTRKLLPVYTGNGNDGVVTETVEHIVEAASSKWVKKRTDKNCLSDDPKDCLVWCLVEIPPKRESLEVVVDMKSTDQFVLKSLVMSSIAIEKSFDWREVVCGDKVDEELVMKLQEKLNEKGAKLEVTGEVDKATKEALSAFQVKSNLAVGNLTIETFDALGIKI